MGSQERGQTPGGVEMTESIRALLDQPFELAEGPVWFQGLLWWVDIMAGTLHRWDPTSQEHESRDTGDLLGAAVPCTDGRWLLAQNRSLVVFDWERGTSKLIATLDNERPRNRCNDGKCDPQGRFWFGTMNMDSLERAGSLYCQSTADGCQPRQDGVTISNGIAWSRDGDVMYYIDSPTRRVDAFDFDQVNGHIHSRRTLIEFGEQDGWPDGMTIDVDELLWIAMWGGAKIAVVDSKSGERVREIPMPVSQPTSCTFGGDDLGELFVTSAWEGMTARQREAESLAGSVFRLRPGATGRAVQCFG
jgi:sugar lactone lactonase YvrE